MKKRKYTRIKQKNTRKHRNTRKRSNTRKIRNSKKKQSGGFLIFSKNCKRQRKDLNEQIKDLNEQIKLLQSKYNFKRHEAQSHGEYIKNKASDAQAARTFADKRGEIIRFAVEKLLELNESVQETIPQLFDEKYVVIMDNLVQGKLDDIEQVKLKKVVQRILKEVVQGVVQGKLEEVISQLKYGSETAGIEYHKNIKAVRDDYENRPSMLEHQVKITGLEEMARRRATGDGDRYEDYGGE